MGKLVSRIPFIVILIAGIVVLIVSFFITMLFGAGDATFHDVWSALASNVNSEAVTSIREIRLPREIAAVFVGAALAVSGAIMQGVTRNPLADPGLLGVTAGANAALAVTLAFLPNANYYAIMVACIIGAAVGTLIVLGIGAVKKGGFSPFRIVLAGAAVTAFLNAAAEGIGLYFKISKDVSMWTAGGLMGTAWEQLKVVIPFIAIGVIVSFILSRQLTILSLNRELAVGLGQKSSQIKIILFIVIILLAGSAVALAGNLAFLGLMIPHIVRTIVGTDYRLILPMSAVIGPIFMLLADTFSRTINAPYETPIAAIVSILGLPFFLFVVHKGGRAFS
ncbi:FecCD family ABC transporter permease [Scopulibacillus cellulosilyticus]|uniref:FecCD family ABC transporter permease n=1 Tax=Scopulibacillus cellulosilyticus TaxID=2665665 RepID=A0ABW2PZS1_9BACL